jgi:hypothetical protein
MKCVKGLLVAGALAGMAPAMLPVHPAAAQDRAAAAQVNEEQLGQMIAAIGLEPEKKQQRYDFAFRATMDDQEWELSMSAVLSTDESSIWLMAWLDELPKASSDVPRTALLRLLAQNDQLGNGKFFAYIPGNRRFVLQRTIPNQGLTSAQLRLALQDLGTSVVETYPVWSVSNWSPSGIPAAPTGQAQGTAEGKPTQAAENESKFAEPVRR